MIEVEDWAEIRRLHFAEGRGIKAIARHLGLARNTVRAAVRSQQPPRYERPARGSAVDAVDDEIRRLLKATPDMPASVIAERIGWQRGMTILRDRVAELRPVYAPTDPCQRTVYRPGELAQWDIWFPPVEIPLGWGQTGRLPVLVGVSGYSRLIVGRMIPSRQSHDVLGGHLWCVRRLGGVPREGVYDSEPAIGRRRGDRVEFSEGFQRFRGVLGMGAYICRPRDPEAKGLVERANGFLETSFLPGRTFSEVEDFNAQLQAWLERANQRMHRGIGARPVDRLAEDTAAMLPLPPLLPDVRLRWSVRLGRDHYVRYGTCDYSVHPKAIGRRVEVAVDLDWVMVTCAGAEVARHRRSLATHRVFTDPVHGRAARRLRAQAHQPVPAETEVEQRDLADYDRALGVAG